jgi:transcriptional regulator with XRE-family HTH domain
MISKGKAKNFTRRAKARLAYRGITLTQLAATLGVRRETVSRAIHGHRGSDTLRKQIKEVLDV